MVLLLFKIKLLTILRRRILQALLLTKMTIKKLMNNCSLLFMQFPFWQKNTVFQMSFIFLRLSNNEASTFIDVFSERCDFYVQVSSGVFSSSEFESFEECYNSSWVITAPLNQSIRLKFETFQLSDSRLGQNLIRIYDGRKTADTLLGVFTGARRPFTIQSSGPSMLVNLTIDSRVENTLRDFKGVYTFETAKGKFLIFHPLHTNSSQ